MSTNDGTLRSLGEGVYMAYGKVVQVRDPSVDAATEAGRDEILSFARNSFEGRFSPRPWGVLTVNVMLPKVQGKTGLKHAVSCSHFSAMPECVREKLREEFPDHADEI